ncbi:MAG: AAA domain-containing protein [Bacteroidota bacterium]
MRQILHSYKLRLTNLSQGNRSLRLGKLSRHQDIDLRDLHYVEDDGAEEIFQKVLAGRDIRLLSKLNPRLESSNIADRRLNNIYRRVETLMEETGNYDLFVGYPFVEGKFIDGTVVRCPVLLFPVKLERNLKGRPRWKLKVLKDEPIEFNKTFFLAYEQYNQVRLADSFWEEEIPPSKDWRSWLTALYEKIKAYEIDVNFNSDLFEMKLKFFEDKRKEEMDQQRMGILRFEPHAVLGIFPQSDSALLGDYEKIEEQAQEFNLDYLFQTKNYEQTTDIPYVKEESRFFVTPVDHSQEEAILKVKNGRSLVIHGPPGTGKSQVIVNILADAMAHGKKVLLVSQKRAALDVVYRRLEGLGLSRFAVLVHDYRHDRNSIYRQIRQQIDDFESFRKDLKDLNFTKWSHDFKRLSREVDQLNREFESLYQALTTIRSCGLSMHDLYLQGKIEGDPLPLRPFAKQHTIEQLHRFLDILGQLWEYRDLLDPQHPWFRRVSFQRYQHGEKTQLIATLGGIKEDIEKIAGQYERLTDTLSTRLLDVELNKERISAFEQVATWLEEEVNKKDFEAFHANKLTKISVETYLHDLEKALDNLDKRKYLDDGYWSFYAALIKHRKAYQKYQTAPLRSLSLAYQRAKWFFKKVLEPHQVPLDHKSFHQLQTEVAHFEQLHKWYVRHHDEVAFADFSLFDDQKERRSWLERKRRNLQSFEELASIRYFPKIKPRFRKGTFDMAHWELSMKSIQNLQSFTRSLEQTESYWRNYFHPVQIDQLKPGFKNIADVQPYLEKLKQALEADFEDLRDLDRILHGCSSSEKEAIESLIPFMSSATDEKSFLARVAQSVAYHWVEIYEAQDPILAEVSSRSFGRKEREFIQKFQQRRQKVTELIQHRLKDYMVEIVKFNRLKNPVTYREIYHQVSKKRLIWSIRKLIQQTWNTGLQQLVPCWMASPESAAAIFPMEKDFFDLVIFDEASQCFVERAIPVILRGKQAVIAGDSQQLQPTNLYKVRYEDAGEDAFVENELALEVESILDLAQNTFDEAHLTWHYRSQSQELINFSNQAFYEGRLQVIPAAQADPVYTPALAWISVAGVWDRNRNKPEAERVVQLVKELVQQPDRPSIGIVTFNFHQQELIRDLLDRELERLGVSDPALYELVQQSMHQHEGEEFQGLFVKNIENVQGDERDIIVFSVGYGYSPQGKLSTNFGLLNRAGGENRLNVAITRARKKIYMVCSFDPSALKVDQAAHQGPRLFKDYLRFVKALSEQREQDAVRVLNAQHEVDITAIPPNPIADAVSEKLEAEGYYFERNYGATSYKLDLAIKAPGARYFYKTIECEGPNYFSGASAKEREIYRRTLLESKGWEFQRIWARNFWKGKWDV